jgi:hypothetical protein
MQRVRISLSYFAKNGWEVEVAAVAPCYTDVNQDTLLIESVPSDVKIHLVKALPKHLTKLVGLGSLALRALPFYRSTVDNLMKNKTYDLIYFSTTQFPICILGVYWKKRFGVPYVIDMQDPWHSEYYKNKPKHQQPAKYWFSYRLNKYTESIAMKKVDGLISVSGQYIQDIKDRYPVIAQVPVQTIPFGLFEHDKEIAIAHASDFKPLLSREHCNIVYIGRGGVDMHKAITPLFKILQTGLSTAPDRYSKLRFYFIGTSYAPVGEEVPTILPLAATMGVGENVIELTGRISYYHALDTLTQADALFIPGSDDPRYNASKIFPYLLTKKPLLALFHPESPAIGLLKEFGAEWVYDYRTFAPATLIAFLMGVVESALGQVKYDTQAFQKYSAKELTVTQCRLFDQVLTRHL